MLVVAMALVSAAHAGFLDADGFSFENDGNIAQIDAATNSMGSVQEYMALKAGTFAGGVLTFIIALFAIKVGARWIKMAMSK